MMELLWRQLSTRRPYTILFFVCLIAFVLNTSKLPQTTKGQSPDPSYEIFLPIILKDHDSNSRPNARTTETPVITTTATQTPINSTTPTVTLYGDGGASERGRLVWPFPITQDGRTRGIYRCRQGARSLDSCRFSRSIFCGYGQVVGGREQRYG